VDIADFITPERVIVGFEASSKSHLLVELARRAATATGLPQKRIGGVLKARESLESTGVGAGIAIPQAQIAGLDHFYGLFVRLNRPIEYDAIDGRPVDVAFLLLIPPNAKEHLQALASVARRLREPDTASDLRRAAGAREAYEVLTRTP
jgi:nitrogen PTS system EIIA component